MSHVTLRTAPELEYVLAVLTKDGHSRSRVIRDALLEMYRHRIRAEAEAVAADPTDLAEAHAIQAEMAPLRAW